MQYEITFGARSTVPGSKPATVRRVSVDRWSVNGEPCLSSATAAMKAASVNGYPATSMVAAIMGLGVALPPPSAPPVDTAPAPAPAPLPESFALVSSIVLNGAANSNVIASWQPDKPGAKTGFLIIHAGPLLSSTRVDSETEYSPALRAWWRMLNGDDNSMRWMKLDRLFFLMRDGV